MGDEGTPAGVVRASFESMRGWAPYFAGFEDAVLDTFGGVTRWRSSVPLPLANAVVGFPEDGDVDAVVRGFFPPGWPLVWVAPAETGLAALLAERGYEVVDLPAMAVPLADLPEPTLPAGVEVFRVDDDPGLLREALRVALVTNGFPEDAVGPFHAAFGRMGAERGRIETFLATVDGVPAASSTLIDTDGVAGIYNVGTLEEHRGRGLGRAVSLAALRAGRRRGRAWGVLQATELGEPVYRALGFAECGRVTFGVGTATV